jgi:hypothetical protein
MSDPIVDELLAKALSLPPAARAALAGSLLESLDEGLDEDAEAAWARVIEQRRAQLDSGAVRAIPWSEARRKLLGS